MKSLRAFIFAIVAVCTLTATTPSKAAIGLGFASPVTIITGAVIAGGGVIAVGASDKAPDLGSGLLMFFGGISAAILGLLVLDGEEGQLVAFGPLSMKDAQSLKISKLEVQAFNRELDQINALASYVDHEVAQIKEPTSQDAANVWNDVKSEVSPEAFRALVKVSENSLR